MNETQAQVPHCCTTGLAHAAESMIRALGGCAVSLLFPMASADESPVPGLGLGGEATQRIELAPVAIVTLPMDAKLAAAQFEVLIPASAVFMSMVERLAATPQNFFDSALGLVHEGRLLRINAWTAEYFAGSPYMFRVTVQG